VHFKEQVSVCLNSDLVQKPRTPENFGRKKVHHDQNETLPEKGENEEKVLKISGK